MAVAVPQACAQQSSTPTPPQLPSAAVAPLSPNAPATPSAADAFASPANQEAQPGPLTGIEQFLLGGAGETHNFFQTRFEYEGQSNSRGFYTVGTGRVVALDALYGGLSLDHTSARSEFSLDYVGGGVLVPGLSGLNATVEEFAVRHVHHWQRWTLMLQDQYSYLPQSAFGYSLGGFDNLGSGLGGTVGQSFSGLNSGLVPNQSVLSANGRRTSNVFASELDYQLSPRSSLTAVGSYGLLRFADPALLNNSDAVFQLGYNYKFSRRESIGLFYRYMGIRVSGRGLAVLSYSTQLAFQRQLSQRLAFRFAAGPEITAVRVGLTGSQRGVLLGIGGSLQYNLRRTYFGLSYSQGVTGGSGVLPGAETAALSASAGRTFARSWHGSISTGYALNQLIANSTQTSTGQKFHSWFGSLQLRRSLGPELSLFLNVTEEIQTSRLPVCSALVCGSNSNGHQVTVGFSWQRRPEGFPW